MRITTSQLRTIIAEEVARLSEGGDSDRRSMEYFVRDVSVNAGLTGPDFPTFESLTSKLNLPELSSSRYLGRRPSAGDLELLRSVWEEARAKWGPKGGVLSDMKSLKTAIKDLQIIADEVGPEALRDPAALKEMVRELEGRVVDLQRAIAALKQR